MYELLYEVISTEEIVNKEIKDDNELEYILENILNSNFLKLIEIKRIKK